MKIGNRIWNWYLSDDGTLMIFNGNYLYWKLEDCGDYSEHEINIIAKEFILQNQYILNSSDF